MKETLSILGTVFVWTLLTVYAFMFYHFAIAMYIRFRCNTEFDCHPKRFFVFILLFGIHKPIVFARTYSRLRRKYGYTKFVRISWEPDPYFDEELNENAVACASHSINGDEWVNPAIKFCLIRSNDPVRDLAHEFCHLLQYDIGPWYTNHLHVPVTLMDKMYCVRDYGKTDYLERQATAFELYEAKGKVDKNIIHSLKGLFYVHSLDVFMKKKNLKWDQDTFDHFHSLRLSLIEVMKMGGVEKVANNQFIHLCEEHPFINRTNNVL